MAGKIVIVGATSGIGQALARRYAEKKHSLWLLGRDRDALERLAADCRIRYGVEAQISAYDAENFGEPEKLFTEATLHDVDGAVLCQGYLGDNSESRRILTEWKRTLDVNFLSVVACLTPLANVLEKRQSGFLCVVSSVAGVRGRQSNYVYGSAKGAVSVFLEGLRHRLFKAKVSVTEIRPGFVDTSMTFGLPGLFLVAKPEKVAGDIACAIEKKKAVAYTPFFWWAILTIIKCLPRFVFHRSKL